MSKTVTYSIRASLTKSSRKTERLDDVDYTNKFCAWMAAMQHVTLAVKLNRTKYKYILVYKHLPDGESYVPVAMFSVWE